VTEVAGPTNAEQREYWNGADSREWIESPDQYDEMLAPFGELVLERAELRPGTRVLDVGCGNGATTLDAARAVAPAGEAVGIDLSEPMLDIARDRAKERGVANASFVVADAQVEQFDAPFDVLISRFGIMFFDDPEAAFANLADAVAPGGRLVFVCWRPAPENEWVSVPMAAALQHLSTAGEMLGDAPGPFRYGDPSALVSALERAGMIDVAIERVDTTILLGGRGSHADARDWIGNSGMTRRLLGEVDPDLHGRVVHAMGESLEPFVTDEGVRIGSAVWIVTARRPD
jgi:SAM-dependent methyltransferase